MEDLVILVDNHDNPVGLMPKMEAHQKALLHRAFSVFLTNDCGEILLQQRAKSKYHSPGLWTNTCCSHQRENETSVEAGKRRLQEEMGIEIDTLSQVFSFIYKAPFDNGLTEHELDHVLVGHFNGTPNINPDEVHAWKWASAHQIKHDIALHPEQYTVWFKIIFDKYFDYITQKNIKMEHYPMKFRPIFKERLWGGTQLKSVLNKDISSDITGESWELSAVEGDVSIVANGSFEGQSLQDLIHQYPQEILGKSVYERFGEAFPILIKFIDAQQDLSIQVHPNDELAQKRHNCLGKTEMWFVMQAEENAQLIVGFNKNTDQKEYETHLKQGTLTELMNYESVKKGSTFFINTGKVHAIGAGILLAEIQQTSDITYRVYDFNRKDKHGNLRELHTEQALDAIDYEKKDDFKVEYSTEANTANPMVSCPYFITQYLKLDKDFNIDISQRDSFSIYICVDGNGTLSNENGSIPIRKGETVMVPAASKHIQIETLGIELLEVFL